MMIENEAVYQIYVRSFADSNGDGVGDLKGITQHLDYIKELGVSYIWLTPFFISPGRDNGYDVANYYAIDPLFGTMADFEELIDEAKKRNLAIMLDMVFNHTSTEHEWFQKALAGDSYYKDFYFFKKSAKKAQPPTNWLSKFGGSAWQYVEKFDQYYLHLFDKTQADLNWDNPNVRAELYKVVNFWLAKGVKGFRFDVINLISKPHDFVDDNEGDGRRFYTDGPKIHTYLKELNAETFGRFPDILTVGEMSSTSIENCLKYANAKEKELSMVFSFHHLKLDYKDGNKWSLMPFNFEQMKHLFENWQTKMQKGGAINALFWSNHDQPRIVSRMGDDEQFHYESATMLATANYFMHGVPYIYQGEEIGLPNAYFKTIEQYQDVESLNYYRQLSQSYSATEALKIIAAKSRDNGRTPIPWQNKAPYFGFSTAKPWLGFSEKAAQINAENDLKARKSIYKTFQYLLKLRKTYSVLTTGIYCQILKDHPQIYAFERTLDEHKVVVLCNFYKQTATVDYPIATKMALLFDNYQATLAGGEFEATAQIDLKPYQALVLYV